jgi:hypothetical protein
LDVCRGSIVAVALALAACQRRDRESGDAAPPIRDSAGIAIVDNGNVDPASVPRWSIDTTPSITIGRTAGDMAYELAHIGSVQRLPNGMILVLNGQGDAAFEFRFYDSTGKHVATHGRRGQGPGEYRWISFVGSVGGDTVVGLDFPNGRLNWVSASAGYLRSLRLEESGFPRIVDSDAGGLETLLPLGDSLYAVKVLHENIEMPGGQRSTTYHIVDLGAGTSADLAPYAEAPLKEVMLGGRLSFIAPINAARTSHVVDRARRRICAATSTVTEISCVEGKGRRMRIRWPSESVPYTSDDRRAFEESFRSMRRGSREDDDADVNRMLATIDWPERHDPFSTFQIDGDGNLWILEYTMDRSGTRQSRFRILDPEGRQVGFTDPFPTDRIGTEPMHIGSTSVLRVIETPDGAPAIGVFRIRKPD